MTKLAEYEVERLAVYSGTQVRGQIRKLTVWHDEERDNIKVQIGNGKMYPCHLARDHENKQEFWVGDSKPQRWSRI